MIGSSTVRRWRRRDRGAAAVEMALVMPLLLLVLFAIIDFGRMLNTQITLTEAAREGARAEAYGHSASDRVAVATDLAVSTTVVKSCPNADGYAEVAVAFHFEFVTPLAVISNMFGSNPDGEYDLSGKGVMTCAG